MEKIIFKDIPGYEGSYQATSNGDIYACPKTWVTNNGGIQIRKGKFLSKQEVNGGYLSIKLCKNGIYKRYLIHRLVAICFILQEKYKNEVNHKNGDKKDNRVENLEWCTRKQNMVHAFKNGLGSTKEANKTWEKKVININDNTIYDSIVIAASSIGMKRKTLSMMLNGNRKNKTALKFL